MVHRIAPSASAWIGESEHSNVLSTNLLRRSSDSILHRHYGYASITRPMDNGFLL